MPEIRIDRIISRLSTPRTVLIPIVSTTGKEEIDNEKKSTGKDITNKNNIIPSSPVRSEEASACKTIFLVCEVCEIKYYLPTSSN
jgi:hypothetical protein